MCLSVLFRPLLPSSLPPSSAPPPLSFPFPIAGGSPSPVNHASSGTPSSLPPSSAPPPLSFPFPIAGGSPSPVNHASSGTPSSLHPYLSSSPAKTPSPVFLPPFPPLIHPAPCYQLHKDLPPSCKIYEYLPVASKRKTKLSGNTFVTLHDVPSTCFPVYSLANVQRSP